MGSLATAQHDITIPQTRAVSDCYGCNKRHLTLKAVHLDQCTAFDREYNGELLKLGSHNYRFTHFV